MNNGEDQVKDSESVNKTRFNIFCQPGSFLWQETRRILIGYRIVNINFSMSDIVITTNNQVWYGFPQFLYIIERKKSNHSYLKSWRICPLVPLGM